jgi:hypothetical protein
MRSILLYCVHSSAGIYWVSYFSASLYTALLSLFHLCGTSAITICFMDDVTLGDRNQNAVAIDVQQLTALVQRSRAMQG